MVDDRLQSMSYQRPPLGKSDGFGSAPRIIQDFMQMCEFKSNTVSAILRSERSTWHFTELYCACVAVRRNR